MGILNITPDSFYDGGRYQRLDAALVHAEQMVQEGADIIDVGGESTRPGAREISSHEECDRILPLIERLKQHIHIPISIDSRHPEVIQSALAAGASIVNDISGLADPDMLKWVVHYQVPVCIMHMQGTPQSMQTAPHYQNLLAEIRAFFIQRTEMAKSAGVLAHNIWLDPGFGFGKTLAHNLTLLANLSYFKDLGYPLLVGLSRKSLFGALLKLPIEERLYSSLAAAMLAQLQGATIIRTHDVKPTREVLAVVNAVQPYWQAQDEYCT